MDSCVIIIENSSILRRLGFVGLAVWPFILVKEQAYTQKGNSTHTLRHERIHIRQQLECLLVGFFALYAVQLLVGLLRYGSLSDAYHAVCFEMEAYDNENKGSYLRRRRPFAFLQYLL